MGYRQSIALIFAGGTGQRMNSTTRPKQFLELHGKPIIVYTLEQFENHPDVDAIVVVCLESWIPFMEKLVAKFDLGKVVQVIPGGASGQESIRNGVDCIFGLYPGDSVVLVHDGVRPLVDAKTISLCIAKTCSSGNGITVVPAIETVIMEAEGKVSGIVDRKECAMAKAPQGFVLSELKAAHDRAVEDGRDDFIDSASLMRHYGHDLFTVEGTPENIKITTPSDFYIFRALVDARENSQVFGL